MNPTTAEVNEKLKMEVKAKILVANMSEDASVSWPITAVISKVDNKSLYELRDFFKVTDEEPIKFSHVDGSLNKRSRFRGILVSSLRGSVPDYDLNLLLSDVIQLQFKSVSDLNSYLPSRIDSLIVSIRNAYAMQLQDNTTISIDYK